MPETVLMTGAGSSFGSKVLEKILPNYKVISLVRNTQNLNSVESNLEIVKVDLLAKNEILEKIGKVKQIKAIIHMAGVTDANGGKMEDNVTIARSIAMVAKKIKPEKIIFISSNAVNYSQRPYAVSKKEAEEILETSGIPVINIRPTLVISEKSPEIRKVLKVVRYCPVVPLLFGGETKLQPIRDDDLVEFIVLNVGRNVDKNEIYTIGGDEVISQEEFLKRVFARYGIKRLIMKLPVGVSQIMTWLGKLGNRNISDWTTDLTVDTSEAKKIGWKPKSQILA